MEKRKVHFIVEKIQQWKDGFKDEKGDYYLRKYLITTQPFTFLGQEYSQLEIYANGSLEFQDVGFADLIKGEEKEKLKHYLWEIWWWENQGDDYYPPAKIGRVRKRITVSGKHLHKIEKACFAGNSLTVSPTENGLIWDEKKGRLGVKIKPVKISDKIEVNQLDFLGAGRLFGTDFNQVISDNFRFGKVVTIYFDEKRGSQSLNFELEKGQTKLVIFLSYLKNKFRDYSWFSSVDDEHNYLANNQSEPPGKKPVNSSVSPSNNGGKWFVGILLLLGSALFFFWFYQQISKKKKKKRTNSS